MKLIKKLKRIIEIIRDPGRPFSERIFILLTIISDLAVTVSLIGDIITGESINEILVLVATIILVPAITFTGLYYNRLELSIRLIVVGLVFLILPTIFFFGGGVEGGGVLWFIFAFMYIGLVISGTWRNVMLILIILFAGGCYIADFFFPELVRRHSRYMFYIDSYLSLVMVGLVCFVMVMFQNRLFRQENEIAKKEAERAEELMRSQNRFFSSMSHEIRTPINSILGLNELILRDPDDTDEVIRDANGIAGAGKLLLALINDILDFSKIEAGSMDIVPVDYRVGNMLSEVVNMIWLRAMEKGLQFDVSVDPAVPSVLYGDEVRIKQILINLLNNAVKYTKEGNIGLHLESEPLGEDVLLRISVSDTGMGIKKDSLPYLFDAFKRVDEEKNRYIEGTGLGLSIVKQLVDLMGGDITVNSIYGEGSTFNIVLRQGISDMTEVGELSIHNYGKAKRSSYESAFTAPDARILIVDDNEMNLEVEKKLLSGTGMRTDTVLSGSKALEMTLLQKYDVILMDHLMPEMDGIECLEAMRDQAGGLNNSTPVIVLTANAGSEDRELYKRSGFDGCLIKPVSGETMEETLIHYIHPDKLMLNSRSKRLSEDMNAMRGYSRKAHIVIATSSMCDLPDSLMKDPHLPVIPFKVLTQEGEFNDNQQMDTEEMVRYMQSGKKAFSSAPSVSEYVEFFSENLRNAHHLIYIAITQSMSDDYRNACEAAKSFDNVKVINSECVSSATGFLVMIAYKLSRQDITMKELTDELESVKKNLRCSFVIDSPDNMMKKGLIGARIGKVVKALDMRISISVKDGKTVLGGFWLGGRRSSYRKYIKKALQADAIPDKEIIFITYVGVDEDTLLWIRNEISRITDFEHVIFQKASAAIATNCGSGSFGILYFTKNDKNYNLSSLIMDELNIMEPDEDPSDDRQRIQDILDTTGVIDETGDKTELFWYEMIEGIDGGRAIQNSGSEETLHDVLKLFYEAIDTSSSELNGYYDNEDWDDYTIKVHALKSSAKIIGAISLSDEAQLLENAGKDSNTAYIREHHGPFMERYIGYRDALAPLFEEDRAKLPQKEQDKRPVADKFIIESVYEVVCDAAGEMDINTIEEAFEELKGYAIPDEEREKFDSLKAMAASFDYEGITELLQKGADKE
ncbi:MAG: DegV family EDD domain-containing protein [Lachnospiraceae bacterium]|nr:DegV family EDD domain-containing protein [Lachnospiraceae bacterium]